MSSPNPTHHLHTPSPTTSNRIHTPTSTTASPFLFIPTNNPPTTPTMNRIRSTSTPTTPGSAPTTSHRLPSSFLLPHDPSSEVPRFHSPISPRNQPVTIGASIHASTTTPPPSMMMMESNRNVSVPPIDVNMDNLSPFVEEMSPNLAGIIHSPSTHNFSTQSQQQSATANSVEYYHAHMAMFIKKKFEEEEEYLMYSYPNEITSPNIHIRSLKDLRGTLHSVFGECNDILSEQVRFCYLEPTGRSVSSNWWNIGGMSSSTVQQYYNSTSNAENVLGTSPQSPLSISAPSTSGGTPLHNVPSGSIGSHGILGDLDNHSTSSPPSKTSLLEFLQETKKIEQTMDSPLAQNVIHLRETIEKNKKPLIITYKVLKQYIFLLYLPIPSGYCYGNVMKLVYEQYVNELFEFLDFIYQDVEEIITNINEYQPQLDTIFNRFFEMVFHDRDFSFVNSFEEGFVKFQPSFHISQTIEAELSNLETIMKEDCFNIGTCLIYKGLLQVSHLPKNITKQVIRYLTHFNIIHRAQDSPEMVIIEKVFVKEESNPFGLLTFSSPDNGYDYLLSVITQGEKVMCSVLYAKRHIQSYYEGDLYFVDEMRTCLLQLEKKGIFSQIRSQFKTSHSLANVLSLPTMAEVTSPSGTITRSDSFSGRESLNVSMDTSNMKHFVTQGPYNILLSYVVHSNSNGVILFHTNENPAIAAMFSLKCQVVRQVLQSKRFIAEDPVVEFGIHIDQKIPLSATSTGHIGYWICGRMNDKMDEFYICYEDSIPQDVVELSYRLYSRLYI